MEEVVFDFSTKTLRPITQLEIDNREAKRQAKKDSAKAYRDAKRIEKALNNPNPKRHVAFAATN